MKKVTIFILLFTLVLGVYLIFVGSPFKGFPLRIGSTGKLVKKLQEKLNKKGHNLTLDSSFGIGTQKAVLKELNKKEVSYINFKLL